MLANLLFLQATPLPELMGLLGRLPIPAPAVLLLATLVRFLPTALQEVRRVVEAQQCRGLERWRLLTPSGLLSLAVPLFLAQIQRSHDLALSLEIRGYASSPRS
jgi:energy-coupling factor transport system permease protein